MAGSPVAVAKPQPPLPTIVERYLKGELKALADESHVTIRTMYRWMLAGLGDEQYQDLITETLVARIADADMLLEKSTNPFEVQKAREIARFARFDLERRRPGLYGPKQEVKHSGAMPSLSIVLLQNPTGGAPEMKVVDGTAETVAEIPHKQSTEVSHGKE